MANDKDILKSFDDLVTTLNDTKGVNAKLELLQSHQHLKPLIKRIWDPNTKTGVTKKGLEDFAKKNKVQTSTPQSLYGLIDDLCNKTLTGDRAKASVWAYISRYPTYEDLILRIVEKKPRIRMAETLLLKAFPGIFEIFKVCLAQEWTSADFDKEYKAANQIAFISKKIDGVRLITVVKDNTVKFYSRTGHEWTSLGKLRRDLLDHIVPEMTEDEISEGTVYDGELVALDAAGVENFKETVSQSRKKDIEMANPRYKIIDKIPLSTFQQLEVGPLLATRLAALVDIFQDAHPQHCEILQQTRYTDSAFARMSEEAKQKKWEGLMIRFNAPYEAKRTRRLLKFKFFINEEFAVVHATILDMPFPNSSGGEDMKRALKNVTIHYKDCPVSVGSGFSADERLMFAANPKLIQGKMIMVEYQEPFYDEKKKTWSLRCPIFKALIGDDRDF